VNQTSSSQPNSPRISAMAPNSKPLEDHTGLSTPAEPPAKPRHRLNPAAKPFTPSVNRSNATTPELQLNDPLRRVATANDAQYTVPATYVVPTMHNNASVVYHQLCMFCYEPTDGLFFYTCPSRIHVAHAGCLTGYEKFMGKALDENQGLTCACPGYPPYSGVGIHAGETASRRELSASSRQGQLDPNTRAFEHNERARLQRANSTI
jgi:hypothetical protein